jgi:hypothetical protein
VKRRIFMESVINNEMIQELEREETSNELLDSINKIRKDKLKSYMFAYWNLGVTKYKITKRYPDFLRINKKMIYSRISTHLFERDIRFRVMSLFFKSIILKNVK